jgi:hypothetical protein
MSQSCPATRQDLIELGDALVDLDRGWEFLINRGWVDDYIHMALSLSDYDRTHLIVSLTAEIDAFSQLRGLGKKIGLVAPDREVLETIWNMLDRCVPEWMDEDWGPDT